MVAAIGIDNLKSEIKKWPDTPCQRANEIDGNWEYTYTSHRTWWDTPSNWSSTAVYSSGTLMKYGYRCYKSLQNNNVGHIPSEEGSVWWEDVTVRPGTYNAGDVIFDGHSNYYQFRVKAGKTVVVTEDQSSNNRQDHLVGAPFIKLYNTYPHEGGCFDSIYRISNWIKEKIRLTDISMNYNE